MLAVRTKAEISKVFDENVGHIFTPHRARLNESKPGLRQNNLSMMKTKTICLDDLHQDDDGSTDDEEETVQIGSDILIGALIKILRFFFNTSDKTIIVILITGSESVRFDRTIFGSSDIL